MQPMKGEIAFMGCGGNHPRAACKLKNAVCQWCDRKGHLAKVCPASQPASLPYNRRAQQKPQKQGEECYTVSKGTCWAEPFIRQANFTYLKKINVTVLIKGAPCRMEVDTRSSMTIISWSTIKKLVPRLSKSQLRHQCLHL